VADLKEVTAVVANQRLMPTHSSQDLKFKIERPDYITLSGAKVVAGMVVENDDMGITREQKNNPETVEVANIPGLSAVKVRWIVQGGGKYTCNRRQPQRRNGKPNQITCFFQFKQ
jgi:hypothetical protein